MFTSLGLADSQTKSLENKIGAKEKTKQEHAGQQRSILGDALDVHLSSIPHPAATSPLVGQPCLTFLCSCLCVAALQPCSSTATTRQGNVSG